MAKVDAQDYLSLLEAGRRIAFFDIEATGLSGDYNSILCVSVKPYGKPPLTFKVQKPGQDKEVVRLASEHLATFDAWVSYYGKGFDVPMFRARMLYHGLPDLVTRHHIDLYFTLKWRIKTSRKSQGHLLSWLKLPEQKMGVPAGVWSEILSDTSGKLMETMVRRCESDTRGLEALYRRTRHLIRDVKA